MGSIRGRQLHQPTISRERARGDFEKDEANYDRAVGCGVGDNPARQALFDRKRLEHCVKRGLEETRK